MEIGINSTLNHPNVAEYFHFRENSTYIKENGDTYQAAYIVQEPVSGGDLFGYLTCGPFNESHCKYLFKQLLRGVKYIHDRGFAHRDLKPGNILLDAKCVIKLVDFGLACPTGLDRETRLGTFGFMAP